MEEIKPSNKEFGIDINKLDEYSRFRDLALSLDPSEGSKKENIERLEEAFLYCSRHLGESYENLGRLILNGIEILNEMENDYVEDAWRREYGIGFIDFCKDRDNSF